MTVAAQEAGHERKLCGADTSDEENPGKTCGLPAGWGTEHKGIGRCRKHLGNTRNHIEAARRQQVEELAAEYLDDPDAPPVANAGDALRRLATRVENALDVVGSRVNQLNEIRYKADGAGTEQIRGEVDIWLRLVKQLESLLKSIDTLRLDERQLQLEEDKARLTFAIFVAALDELEELEPERREFAKAVVARKFAAITTAGVES